MATPVGNSTTRVRRTGSPDEAGAAGIRAGPETASVVAGARLASREQAASRIAAICNARSAFMMSG